MEDNNSVDSNTTKGELVYDNRINPTPAVEKEEEIEEVEEEKPKNEKEETHEDDCDCEECVKKWPISPDLKEVKVNSKRAYISHFPYQGKRYMYKYKNISGKQGEDISMNAIAKSKDCPAAQERAFQDLWMNEAIQEIGGETFDDQLKVFLGYPFLEAFRFFLFKSDGIDRMSKIMLGELTEDVKQYLDSEMRKMARNRNRPRR